MENSNSAMNAIEQGTVIDHIPAGKGLAILRQFKLLHYGSAVTVGLICPVKRREAKTLSKSAAYGWMPTRPTVWLYLPLKQW